MHTHVHTRTHESTHTQNTHARSRKTLTHVQTQIYSLMHENVHTSIERKQHVLGRRHRQAWVHHASLEITQANSMASTEGDWFNQRGRSVWIHEYPVHSIMAYVIVFAHVNEGSDSGAPPRRPQSWVIRKMLLGSLAWGRCEASMTRMIRCVIIICIPD